MTLPFFLRYKSIKTFFNLCTCLIFGVYYTVNAFVIGALVGGVIYNPDMDAWHLIFALAMWTIFNMFIRYCLRFRILRKLIKGDSIYIVKGGALNIRAFKRNNLEMEQFRTLLREKGIFSMFNVDDVRFETNGSLTVSVGEQFSDSYLLVNNGSVMQSSLRNCDKDEEWLNRTLHKQGFDTVSDLFCVEWTPGKGFYVVAKDGSIKKGKMSHNSEDFEDQISL